MFINYICYLFANDKILVKFTYLDPYLAMK